MVEPCKQIQTISARPFLLQPHGNGTFSRTPFQPIILRHTRRTKGVQACIKPLTNCEKHYGIFRVTCVIKEMILCMVYHVKFLINYLR